MIYESEKGYGLQFTKFDEQYNDTIIYKHTKEGIIHLANVILISFGHKSLLEQLNEMQANAAYTTDGKCVSNTVFRNKFEIPSYFINLLLEKHNMKVLGW